MKLSISLLLHPLSAMGYINLTAPHLDQIRNRVSLHPWELYGICSHAVGIADGSEIGVGGREGDVGGRERDVGDPSHLLNLFL